MHLVRVTALLALALLALPAIADESSGESGSGEELEHPIGIGARRRQPSFQSPRQVQSHTFERLASTTPALLEGQPGLSLFESLALGGSPGLRGMVGRRVAVLIDGLRLENSLTPLGGDDLLGLIDPMALRRLEVLQGPGSVAHGSGALGGAIDLQRPHLTPDPRRAWDAHGDLRAAFDSGRLGALGRFDASGQLRGLGLRATAGLRRFADLQSGRGGTREEFTSGADVGAEIEGAWAPRRGRLLRASYELLRQPELPRPDRSRWNQFQRDGRDRDVVRMSYSADEVARWLGSLQTTVRYRHERESRDIYSLNDDLITESRERVAALDAQLTMVSELSIHRVSYGLDFGHDWVASNDVLESISSAARTVGLSPRHLDGSRALQVEAFALDQIAIGSRLAVEVGARGGVANVAAGPGRPAVPTVQRSFGSYASSLHLRYLLGDGLNVVAGLGQGFLSPNLDDLTGSGCHDRGFRRANPTLDPEKSLSTELGLKLDLYGVLTGSFSYAYTQLFDAMVEAQRERDWIDCGGSQTVPVLYLENAAARVHSLDAALQLEFSRWKLISWLTWAYGSSDVAGYGTVPFDRVPPFSGYAAGRYHFAWAKSFVELALRWLAPQDRLGPADRLDSRICPNPGGSCAGSQSYFFLSLRAGMELMRWLRLNLALENLTHERYRAFAAGVPAPGFSGLLGIEASAP